ncbi:phosphatidylglycerophosphatase A family protein [Frigidibacter sp. ROC022]|uniref:phosphatidylglycerophosphatase A family protein n=1 Tax=Frigidibacter sp. ROC022 TaxID=2971796 RepID=UPI00215A7301|nr:phosphatidylglycerophosphatase A [Frigidibacter sp. ROC022]MCR8723443.1 phosphatidylglycerophosphatase A [Frigidibacter sp. ROC022]
MSRMLAIFFGVGLLRPAPGTWGSLAALPLAWAIAVLGGPWAMVAAVVLASGLGYWAAGAELRLGDDPDPGEIVIDEVAGQWLALLPVVIGAAHVGRPPMDLWPGWVAAFLLFRLFDIWKPGPIGWADRKGGALGLMLDDLLAGLAAAIGVALLAALAHGVLMR